MTESRFAAAASAGTVLWRPAYLAVNGNRIEKAVDSDGDTDIVSGGTIHENQGEGRFTFAIVRPDQHVAWRGNSVDDACLTGLRVHPPQLPEQRVLHVCVGVLHGRFEPCLRLR